MVFGGTALALASAGLYLALVHGVSAARLNRHGLRPLVGMEPIGTEVGIMDGGFWIWNYTLVN